MAAVDSETNAVAEHSAPICTISTTNKSRSTTDGIDCGVCSLPPEYCEFTPTIAKCKEWLESHHDDLFQKLFAGVELTEKQQKTTEKHEAKQKRAEEKKMQSKVLIKRIERTKRKYVTGVFGLEVFGIEYV